MKIIVTGSSGLIGSALVETLLARGDAVTCLVRGAAHARRADGAREVLWNPARGELEAAELEGHDAAVHLAGDPIAEGRWTDEKKRRIRESRVQGTTLLAETLAKLKAQPRVLVSASAVGYYGDRGEEVLNEASASGADFLSAVCREWEASTEAAKVAGIRVVKLRFGVVLSGAGGALAKMLVPFKMGAGGRIGSGAQYMSWVAIDDAVGAILHALAHEELEDAVNVVAPRAVTNGEFTKTLGGALGRPTLFSVPAFAARLAFGEMADAALLASQRAQPTRLIATNYEFKYPELEGALRHALAR
ncbi:MAG TPA: TIGR01777 family oxidoreductase [Pyrinomonadaceae bacterium]|nr:TIGR01777 family oxidoreductase [Pyrinomonadaceae bacterium]